MVVIAVAGAALAFAYVYFLNFTGDSNQSRLHKPSHSASISSETVLPDLRTVPGCIDFGCLIEAGQWWSASVPDGYRLHMNLTATAPVSIAILTLDDYEVFVDCQRGSNVAPKGERDPVSCIANSIGGSTAQNSERYWYGTAIDAGFDDSVGCGDYVFLAAPATAVSVTMSSNSKLQYQASDHLTGVCASSALNEFDSALTHSN